MTAPLKVRMLAIPLVWVPAVLGAWIYISTHDFAHTWRQIQLGHPPTFPPPAKEGSRPESLDTAQQALGTVLHVLAVAAMATAVAASAVIVSRTLHRRRRMRATIRWELRLGRDDLANPYRVQEAFEGIAGAIGARWYERVWRGCEHFAVETHRLPDESIRFTVAAPLYLGPAIRGPLEDLYPDVEMIETDGDPTWGGTVVRLKKREPFVLSIQTNRNYEHAFSESLVALLSAHEYETTVQLVLTPAPGFVYRRARRLLKRR